MAAGKKKAGAFKFGAKSQSAIESIAPADKDAVGALVQAIHDQGGIDELMALLDKVETAAAEVGGMTRLRHCLEALQTLGA
jgi:hypothetical protein